MEEERKGRKVERKRVKSKWKLDKIKKCKKVRLQEKRQKTRLD